MLSFFSDLSVSGIKVCGMSVGLKSRRKELVLLDQRESSFVERGKMKVDVDRGFMERSKVRVWI